VWTGVDTSTPLFPEGVSEIESLWSVPISFRLYPQILPPDLRGDTSPHILSILSTPLCLTWRRPWSIRRRRLDMVRGMDALRRHIDHWLMRACVRAESSTLRALNG